MLSISLGPLALPVAPLLWLAALWLARAVAGARAPAGEAPRLHDALLGAALVGLLLARLAYVLPAASAYAAQPWSVLDLRDGGWQPWAGLLGGLAWLLWRTRAQPRWRGALASGVVAGCLLLGAGSLALDHQRPGTLPELTLQALGEATPSRTAPPGNLAQAGGMADLRSLARGQPTVINLWASWCGPCRSEMPVLAQAQAARPDLRFLFVNQGETEAAIQRYLASLPHPLRGVWRDPASRLGPAIGSSGLPTTLFVDAQGQLQAWHFGPLNAAALAARLQRLAPEPPSRR